MKKYLSLFLAVCLLCGMLVMPVSAATTTELNAADALYSLGLFLGTNKGYELNNSLTREQSAMLLVRMLGALETAEAGSYTHPFTDVAPWGLQGRSLRLRERICQGLQRDEIRRRGHRHRFPVPDDRPSRPRLHRRR